VFTADEAGDVGGERVRRQRPGGDDDRLVLRRGGTAETSSRTIVTSGCS
jgi:hypothetical protein